MILGPRPRLLSGMLLASPVATFKLNAHGPRLVGALRPPDQPPGLSFRVKVQTTPALHWQWPHRDCGPRQWSTCDPTGTSSEAQWPALVT
jgi:hypothetical protein